MAVFKDLDQYTIEGYDDQYEVPEINKRHMAKLEVKVCGNEGTVGDEKQEELRKFFHAAIDQIQKEKPEVWTNAKIIIRDMYGQTITITAGKGENKFTLQHDSQGEIHVYRQEQSLWSRLKDFFLSFFPNNQTQQV